MKLTINTDGASRGNPGRASYGFVIKDSENNLIYEQGEYIGETTNNVAEYTAVLEAFKLVLEKFSKELPVEIYLNADSKLVAEQLSGKWKIKNSNLGTLFRKIKLIEEKIGSVTYHHVYREENKEADRLANIALDKI